MYTIRKDNNTLRIDLLKHILRCPLFHSKIRQHSFFLFTRVILIISILVVCSTLVGCGPSIKEL